MDSDSSMDISLSSIFEIKPISMKPTKKKGSKTESSGGSAKIHHYFETVPKPFVPERFDASSSKAFYIQALKDKLKSYDATVESESHTTENIETHEDSDHVSVLATGFGKSNNVELPCDRNACKQKENEAKHWEKKYNDLKQVYLKLNIRFYELEMKINDLSKTVPSVDSDIDTVVSTDDMFTSSEFKILESIPFEKKKDSTFIMQCIEYACKENPHILRRKTLKGVPEWTSIKDDGSEEHYPGKDPLTPEKVERIKELFIQWRARQEIKYQQIVFIRS